MEREKQAQLLFSRLLSINYFWKLSLTLKLSGGDEISLLVQSIFPGNWNLQKVECSVYPSSSLKVDLINLAGAHSKASQPPTPQFPGKERRISIIERAEGAVIQWECCGMGSWITTSFPRVWIIPWHLGVSILVFSYLLYVYAHPHKDII
jgi:hypothetical protein